VKLLIEEQDIVEVMSIANDWYGIMLTQQQAKELIEKNSRLASELYDCESSLDTVGRSRVSEAVINYVMPDQKWQWPCYGDTPIYKKQFDVAFMSACSEKGVKLDLEAWKNES
jgi:hypothetical protein